MIDLVDETFVVAAPDELEPVLCDEARWRTLGLDVSCYEDRGVEGRRWTLGGVLRGSAEVWLEPWRDGVIVHLYLRAEPTSGRRWTWPRLERRFVRPLKQWVLAVKREHDVARPAGTAGVPGPGRQSGTGVPGAGGGAGPGGTSRELCE